MDEAPPRSDDQATRHIHAPPPGALHALIDAEQLPPSYEQFFAKVIVPLGERIAALQARLNRTVIIALNGAQGSGKTTLCRFLDELVLPGMGLRSVVLSLDDFYLGREARMELARTVHPLLATRGVPGTHDLEALQAAVQHIADGIVPLDLPRFDKATDDRMPEDRWQRIDHVPDVVLIEGWCVGATPQPPSSLVTPVNDLERMEDPDGRWRAFVNQRLGADYRDLFARFDALVMLRVADFESVWQGRKRQEDKLRQRTGDRGGHIMADATLRRFLAHYERLTRHMLASMPATADALIEAEDITCRGALA